jgi:hypothetical protein
MSHLIANRANLDILYLLLRGYWYHGSTKGGVRCQWPSVVRP